MDNVVVLADIRTAKLRAKLCTLAELPHGAVIEGRAGLIYARRIFCRKQVAILIDKFGYQTRLGYDQIVDATPVRPAADIICVADWQVTPAQPETSASGCVIPFRRPEIAD